MSDLPKQGGNANAPSTKDNIRMGSKAFRTDGAPKAEVKEGVRPMGGPGNSKLPK